MKWLPHHKFEIISPLTPAQALAAISAHAEPERFFRWRWPSSDNDDKFEGEVRTDGFHLRRIIGYRNSFLPVIDGVAHEQGRGARIVVTMRMFVFVYAFVGLWCAGVLSLAIAGATSGPPTLALIGVLMLGFVYLMTMAGFWFEATKQEQTLRRICRAGG